MELSSNQPTQQQTQTGRVLQRIGEQFAYSPLSVQNGLPVGVRPEVNQSDTDGLVKHAREVMGAQVVAVRG